MDLPVFPQSHLTSTTDLRFALSGKER